MLIVRREYDKKTFSYDCIFPENSTQKDIFSTAAKGVIESVLHGYNGTIFAYGQTGSGKTYTMVGEFDNPQIRGIVPRSFDYIFNRIKKLQKEDPTSKFNINISFIQIYLETIQDLFEPNNAVKIREDPDKGVFLENCLWIKVRNPQECEEAFKKGEKNRVTECTKMNANSSRSHALFIIKIEKNFTDEESNEHLMTQGHLYLVDLAGSERVTKTNAREMRLEEAKKINYSLLILGNCIQSLISPNAKYVSYRDSKLTRILQESLGGNAKTSLIVTISPSGYNSEETLSSLNFGLRAMKVQNKPVINKAQDYQAMCFKLQEDYDKLMENYSKLNIDYNKVCDENEKLKNGETYLNMQKNSIKQQIKNSKIISNEDMEKIKKKFEKEMSNLEKYYNEVMKNKEEENDKILKDINNNLVKKDNDIQNLTQKMNEYELKIKNISEINYDMKKEVEDLQKTCNDMLLEKEQLNTKINSLTSVNKNLTKNINLLKSKKESLLDEESQTENIINSKLKELLYKYKISNNDISSNNFPKIISQLLISLETMNNDYNISKSKLKRMGESIEIINKNYEEKIKKLNNENLALKNNINSLNNENNQINELNNNLKIQKEKELFECKKKIEDLEIRVQQINEDKNNYENIYKNWEKEINELKNNNKILNMNNQSLDSELKRIQVSNGMSEKNLNKIINQIINDNNIFNQIKKQLKKLDTIIDNDLVNINDNNFEYSINKAKTEGNKFQTMIEDINNNNNQNINQDIQLNKNNSNKSLSNSNISELINKVGDNIQENKNNNIIFITSISKVYNKFIELYKKYKINDIEYEKNNNLRHQKNIKSEENLKNNIISITHENIDKFSSMCYNNNTTDLKMELKNLSQKSNNLNSYDVLKISLDILGKLLLRTSSFKDEKELEIENLNGKIIYLLCELDIYKKNWNLSKENNTKNEVQLLNNQLGLKEDEINRLNKDIEEYLMKIKEFTCENNLLKNNIKTKINKNIYNENSNSNNYFEKDNLNMKYNNSSSKKDKYQKENNNSDDEIDNINEQEIENDLAKKQDDIDKINAQLRELNELENENSNKYESKNKKK